ncbi:MAG TPA: N-acetylmuramidase domain-containing protein [Hyphomonas sp.]|nr:N-acetylmuramidase domain-containing protein [Hyphomonas sp.]
MRLAILQAKENRALHAERMAKLVSMRAKSTVRPTQQDWVNAAAALMVEPALLLGVAKKESRGAGFDANGRLTILYEPHVAYRNSARAATFAKQAPDLFYRRWIDPAKVPKSEWHPYRTSPDERWQLLARAADIDFMAALAGTSFGAFQQLGEGAKQLGFRDPLHLMEHLYEGEQAHLEVFLRYLRVFNLVDALRRGDLVGFARYNSSIMAKRIAYAESLGKYVAEARRALA